MAPARRGANRMLTNGFIEQDEFFSTIFNGDRKMMSKRKAKINATLLVTMVLVCLLGIRMQASAGTSWGIGTAPHPSPTQVPPAPYPVDSSAQSDSNAVDCAGVSQSVQPAAGCAGGAYVAPAACFVAPAQQVGCFGLLAARPRLLERIRSRRAVRRSRLGVGGCRGCAFVRLTASCG